MNISKKKKKILSYCDHTLLAQTSTWEQIRAICDDGMAFGTASVCIPPSFVKRAKEYVDRLMPDVVIPMHYKSRHSTIDLDKAQPFLDEFDDEDVDVCGKDVLEFFRDDLTDERTKVILMERTKNGR